VSVGVVIPCYNEARRLDADEVRRLATSLPHGSGILLVDDGSTDATGDLLASIAASTPSVSVLTQPRNQGKAEAVRVGMLALLDAGHGVVGFADADFATPVGEITRLASICEQGPDLAVLGSRVAILGHRIQRTAFRHYTGRVFGTIGSIVLRFPVYDTQCGAKFFRAEPTVRRALGVPFTSRWSFDVELLGRLATPENGMVERLREIPLQEWNHVGDSKLTLGSSLRATADLWAVRRALRRWHTSA
jgi:glycosyltransferase involved in cell wall biosynthesis